MIQSKLLIVGKAAKEPWIEEGVALYARRMSTTLKLSTVWVRDDLSLLNQMQKERYCLALDPLGKKVDSVSFATTIRSHAEAAGARLTLVIGGSDGLTDECRREAKALISLSPLTFPHQLCRLILAEQLYRSCELWRGSPYHK